MGKDKVLSMDGESNGLWGQTFAIAAVLLEDGKQTAQFIGRCPIVDPVNEWVAENVIPQITKIEVNHKDYRSLLQAFMDFYMSNKQDADVVVHMGLPVEAKLFLDAHSMGIIGDWDAPYPLIDISAFSEIRDSVDGYNKAHTIAVPDYDGGTHNPLYDSMAAALAYMSVIK